MNRRAQITALLLVAFAVSPMSADEGMWLFNNPPRQVLKDKYQFDATAEWLTHLQQSSVRFNSGGSGSFVSADGLVMTNHHVGLGALQKLSAKDTDYVKKGFYAKTLAEEFPAVDEELNVLIEIVDVTDRVKAAVKPGIPANEAFAARRAVIAQIESESEKQTKLRSNVITLYQGGQYHLYRFKRYTDVRLVFAPEQQIAFYGGDPDNFVFPRYDLDVCFFRVYENDQPAKVPHYLTWSKTAATENELVFVSGHPGHTDRLNTVTALEYLRDVSFPFQMQRLNRMEVLYSIYSNQGEEEERQAKDHLFGVANTRKARVGGLSGLQDPAVMAQKREQELTLREAVKKRPDLKDCAEAWEVIAEVQQVRTKYQKAYNLFEGGSAFSTTHFGIARTLVRAADEALLPNDQRLEEFHDSDRPSLEMRLFSKEPLYPAFEQIQLEESLGWMCEVYGITSPEAQKILAGKSPRARAAELLQGTKLWDVAERRRLYDGGKKALDASTDTLIALVKLIDPTARALRKKVENEIAEPQHQAYDKIARAKFAIEGTGSYPDATFTLRLAFGTCTGYQEGRQVIPYQTDFGGLYKKVADKSNKYPFDLPERWVERKSQLNLATPFNFVCTADIIGGNSGSPVVNRKGELVGIIFDGNLQSLVWDFAFSETQGRAVSVCAPAITEAVRNVYDATPLADELLNGHR